MFVRCKKILLSPDRVLYVGLARFVRQYAPSRAA